MEDPTSPTTNPTNAPATPWTSGLAQSLGEQRRQIEKFLASRRERMDGVESELSNGLAQIVDELVSLRSETQVTRDELQNREERLRQDAERIEQKQAELDAARAEWEESRRAAEQQQSALLEQIQKQLAERPAAADNSEEMERLTAQRDAAVVNLEETEQLLAEAENKLVQAANAASDSDGSKSDGSEYQKRYEMSLDDIKELREENQRIQEELEKAKSRGPSAAAAPVATDGPMSWEAQKKQLLASLENDYDENEPEDTQQRLQIEEVMQKTDLAVSQKDEEVKELKKLLENQSENIGNMAVGAAAFGEMLDNDQIVVEERESLKQLQEEMRKKLSSAEIEISVERAKMARQWVEIEEKMRQLARQQPDEKTSEERPTEEQEKPARGRWLSRLGLNDIDE